MYWVQVTNPGYEQSRRYVDQVGEVVGHWGPDNSVDGREGLLVEFADGEVVGVAEDEVREVDEPAARRRRSASAPHRGRPSAA